MKKLFLAIGVIASMGCFAQTLNIIPAPVKAEAKQGTFIINSSTKIILEGSGTKKSADFLNSYLQEFYGFKLAIAKAGTAEKNAVVLNFDKIENPIEGAYNFTVDNDKVYIGGDNEAGIFYGIQTLIQLLPAEKSSSLAIQQCSIEDAPRFAYRG